MVGEDVPHAAELATLHNHGRGPSFLLQYTCTLLFFPDLIAPSIIIVV